MTLLRFRSVAIALAALAAPLALSGQVPTPASVWGFEPGADYKIADYGQITDYLRRLDAASDRVQMIEIGKSALGRPMFLLYISSEQNLRQLNRWRDISSRLALARDLDDATARRLAEEGRAIVWVDGGLHATERAHGQMTSLLAHKVATEESAEMRFIRDNVVLLLMPVMNPDGLDLVADWYRKNLGTPFETTNPPVLYHHYVGHDNNRDWFAILQPETQAVSRVLYTEWFPQIVYNHHQTSPPWTRIFVPPFADPVNPHIPPAVTAGVNLVGEAMVKRFADEGKDGAVSRVVFDMWWNGGMRTAPYYHNMIGILTETGQPSPTPTFWDPAKMPPVLDLYGRGRAGTVSTRDPSVQYPYPWKGGWLKFRDAVDYMVTGSMAVLDIGAKRRFEWLYGIYQLGREAIAKGNAGNPFAYVIPAEQWDTGAAEDLVNMLRRGGVEVRRATAAFTAGGKQYSAGSYVIPAAQAFRPYLMDLLEKQVYPDRSLFAGGPPEAPYDLAGWTLPLQMGVDVARVDQSFTATTQPVDVARPAPGTVAGEGSFGYVLSGRSAAASAAANRLLAAGENVSWALGELAAGGRRFEAGSFVIRAGSATRARLDSLARTTGLDFVGLASAPATALGQLRLPRVALYKSWDPSMDEGWTRWLLERYGFPIDTLHDADVRRGDLGRYDAVVLPDQTPDEILNGHPLGTMPSEFVGGLGVEGAAALKRYVEQGGTVLALDGASGFAIQQFGLPVRDVIGPLPSDEFFIPGSLLGLEADPGFAVAYGMRPQSVAFFVGSRAFQVVPPAQAGERAAPPQPVDVVARYPANDILKSGWALGAERHLAGRAAVVHARLGRGDVVLVGFRPQFRGQPRNTFKLVFNTLHAATLAEWPKKQPMVP
ncbi:MAG TPA: M14 family metallopeptidase [Gemmatimonadales bacterium]|nr:M14 family metallopeptidase [Gemmatimonadales bacterium]